MTSESLPAPPAEAARPRGYVQYALVLTRRILARVADGEGLAAICREPGMPSRNSVTRWCRDRPRLGAQLEAARLAAGRSRAGGAPRRYCPIVAEEIVGRLGSGETLSSICADPAMPHSMTVTRWRRYESDFAEAMDVAREAAAERLCDESLEMARAMTPKTAYQTHVALTHMRWLATARAPQLFGRVKPMEAPVEEKRVEVAIRHFKVETRDDGMVRMVSYVADPETRGVERDYEGEWGPPRPSNQVGPCKPPARGGGRPGGERL